MAKISELNEIPQMYLDGNAQAYMLVSNYDYSDSTYVSNKMSIDSMVSNIKDNYGMAFFENGTLYSSGVSVGKDIMQIPYLVYYSESNGILFYYDDNGSSHTLDLNNFINA